MTGHAGAGVCTNSYNPNSMNSILGGERPVVDGRALSVDGDGRVLVDGAPPAGGRRRRAGRSRDWWPTTSPPTRVERGITVDQTNTSVIVDDRLVVKLVGRWAAADRAGRLLERLAAAGSDDVDRLRGRVEWRHPLLGTSTLAIVTEYLPGAEDGWTWAVDDVVALLDGGPVARVAGAPRRTRRPHPRRARRRRACRRGPDAASARLARADDALRRAIDAAEGATRCATPQSPRVARARHPLARGHRTRPRVPHPRRPARGAGARLAGTGGRRAPLHDHRLRRRPAARGLRPGASGCRGARRRPPARLARPRRRGRPEADARADARGVRLGRPRPRRPPRRLS